MKAIGISSVCLATAMLASGTGCGDGLRVGSIAPDFELNNLTGQRAALSQYRGKVVLLGFWAVGCDESQAEALHFKELQEKYPRDLRVVAVHVWEDVPRAQIEQFVEEQRLPYTVLTGGARVLDEQYLDGEIPRLYLLDRQGKIVYTHSGWQAPDREAIERRIVKLVSRQL